MRVQIPHVKRQLCWERASHCKVWGHSAVLCAKTSEPIEMPFGLWARIALGIICIRWGPEVLRGVAMATNFGTQFAITGLWAITLVV